MRYAVEINCNGEKPAMDWIMIMCGTVEGKIVEAIFLFAGIYGNAIQWNAFHETGMWKSLHKYDLDFFDWILQTKNIKSSQTGFGGL